MKRLSQQPPHRNTHLQQYTTHNTHIHSNYVKRENNVMRQCLPESIFLYGHACILNMSACLKHEWQYYILKSKAFCVRYSMQSIDSGIHALEKQTPDFQWWSSRGYPEITTNIMKASLTSSSKNDLMSMLISSCCSLSQSRVYTITVHNSELSNLWCEDQTCGYQFSSIFIIYISVHILWP